MPSRYTGSIINSDCEKFWDENDTSFSYINSTFTDFKQFWEENETPLNNTNIQSLENIKSAKVGNGTNNTTDHQNKINFSIKDDVAMEKNTYHPIIKDFRPDRRVRNFIQYHCLLCNYNRARQEEVTRHLISHFLKTTKKTCLACPLKFDNPGDMVIHMKKVHNPMFSLTKLSCNLCKQWRIFQGNDDERKVREHLIEKHNYNRTEKIDETIEEVNKNNNHHNEKIDETIEKLKEDNNNPIQEQISFDSINHDSVDSGVGSPSHKGLDIPTTLDSIQSEGVEKITYRVLGSLTLLRSNGQESFELPLTDFGDRWDMIDVIVGSQPNLLDNRFTLSSKTIAPEHIQVFMKEDCKAFAIVLADHSFYTEIDGEEVLRDDPEVSWKWPSIRFDSVKTNINEKEMVSATKRLLKNNSIIQ